MDEDDHDHTPFILRSRRADLLLLYKICQDHIHNSLPRGGRSIGPGTGPSPGQGPGPSPAQAQAQARGPGPGLGLGPGPAHPGPGLGFGSFTF